MLLPFRRLCQGRILGRSMVLWRLASTKLVTTEILDSNMFLIGINRPEKRNAVNTETADGLLEAFDHFETNKDLLAAILYGHGGTFCAGFDLSELSKGRLEALNKIEAEAKARRVLGPSMMRFSKPVIAAVDGYAVAGGMELALMCDIRVMEDSATMGVFCRRFGVPLIDGGTVRLPYLIGLSRAIEIILTGRPIQADEAHQIGLVHKVVPVGTALGQAVQYARNVRKYPQECMNADKRSAYYSVFDAKSYKDAFDFELKNGIPVIEKESIPGATKFADGKIGRHGSFDIHLMKRKKKK